VAGEGEVVPRLPFPLVFSFLLVFSFSKREKSTNKRAVVLIQGIEVSTIPPIAPIEAK